MLTSNKASRFFYFAPSSSSSTSGSYQLKPPHVYEMENRIKTKEARKYIFKDLIEMVEVHREREIDKYFFLSLY